MVIAHLLQAVIGIMARIAGLRVRMRITIRGIRIRISAAGSLEDSKNPTLSRLCINPNTNVVLKYTTGGTLAHTVHHTVVGTRGPTVLLT